MKINQNGKMIVLLFIAGMLFCMLQAIAFADEPVRIEVGDSAHTLKEAVEAANLEVSAVIEIVDDVTVPSGITLIVTSNITMVSTGGDHTVSNGVIWVQNGGSLTLGNGTPTSLLTIIGAVNVTNGTININDGVALINPSTSPAACALHLEGPDAKGEISGGHIEGYTALQMNKGSYIIEISGGEFMGRSAAVEASGEHNISGTGPKIGVISGGTFQKTDSTISRSAFHLDNGAQIGLISGGTFEAANHSALLIIRGSWVETISGGEFITPEAGDMGAITIYSNYGFPTGIGTISGGRFQGSVAATGSKIGIGIWLADAHSQIRYITGGTFIGERGLSTEYGSSISEISGGEIIGTAEGTHPSYGIFNNGDIGIISKQAAISGKNAGIWNYFNGRIGEISGGQISSSGTSATGSGITNYGTIDKISGGVIIGNYNAVSCNGMNKGRLNVISGGVFWAKFSTAITLAYPVQLEPGLITGPGLGRYQSGNDKIFDNESLVGYPAGYHMSNTSQTKTVAGIGGVSFRYLTQGNEYTITYVLNGGVNSAQNPFSYDDADLPCSIADPTLAGYDFKGWTVEYEGGAVAGPVSGYSIPVGSTGNVTLTADWELVTNPGGGGGPTGGGTGSTGSGNGSAWVDDVNDSTGGIVLVVRFVGWEGELLKLQEVPYGGDASAPAVPLIEGYTFVGWDREFTNVTENIVVTALYAPIETESMLSVWALLNLVLGVAGVLLAALAAVYTLLQRKRERQNIQSGVQGQRLASCSGQDDGELKKRKQRGNSWLFTALVMGIAGIVVFLLTEDTSLSMAITDKWTIVNAIIFITEIIAIAFVCKYEKEQQRQNTEEN